MARSVEVTLRRSETEVTPFARFCLRGPVLPPEILIWGQQAFLLDRTPLEGPAEYVQVSAHVIDLPVLQGKRA